LEVDAIDFTRSEIHITQQLVCVTGQKPYLGPPKTRTSVRTVKAASISMAALERNLELYPPVESRSGIARILIDVSTGSGPPNWSSLLVGAARCTVQAGRVSGYRPRKQRGSLKAWACTVSVTTSLPGSSTGRKRQAGPARPGPCHTDHHAEHVRRRVAGH
jgi:hypothetical protein